MGDGLLWVIWVIQGPFGIPDKRRQVAAKVRDHLKAGARHLRVELGVTQEGGGRPAGCEQPRADRDARAEG